jgi:hypothetical protein
MEKGHPKLAIGKDALSDFDVFFVTALDDPERMDTFPYCTVYFYRWIRVRPFP